MRTPISETKLCVCCLLPQPINHDLYGLPSQCCKKCEHHSGSQPTKTLARAQAHEEMLRERLAEWMKLAEQHRTVASDARRQTQHALMSRGLLAERILRAADSSGSHRCHMTAISTDADVRRWAAESEKR